MDKDIYITKDHIGRLFYSREEPKICYSTGRFNPYDFYYKRINKTNIPELDDLKIDSYVKITIGGVVDFHHEEIWIARDIDGSLWKFNKKPIYHEATGTFYLEDVTASSVEFIDEDGEFDNLFVDNSPIKYNG